MNGYDYFGVCDMTLPAAPAPVMKTPPPTWSVARYANDKGHIFRIVKNWFKSDGTPSDHVSVIRRSLTLVYVFVRFEGDDHDVIIRMIPKRGGDEQTARLTFVDTSWRN